MMVVKNTFPRSTKPTTIVVGPASHTLPIIESFWKIAKTLKSNPIDIRQNDTEP